MGKVEVLTVGVYRESDIRKALEATYDSIYISLIIHTCKYTYIK